MKLILFTIFILILSRVTPIASKVLSSGKYRKKVATTRLTYEAWKNDIPDKTLIIELIPLKTTKANLVTKRIEKHLGFIQNSLAKYGIPSLLVFKYINVFQGYALYIDHPHPQSFVERLELPDVKGIYTDKMITINQADTQIEATSPELQSTPMFHKYKCTGIKVAILDQGIHYKHKAFVVPGKECRHFGDRGCRVKVIEDFVGLDLERYNRLPPETRRAGFKQDIPRGSHGTRMASLIGGNDPQAPGIAPEVDFYDYRVMGGDIGGRHTVFSAGMDLALRDEPDVICLSIGSYGAISMEHRPKFKAGTRHEILVATSMGNTKRLHLLFQGTDIANLDTVFRVGAMDPVSIETYLLAIIFSGPEKQIRSHASTMLVRTNPPAFRKISRFMLVEAVTLRKIGDRVDPAFEPCQIIDRVLLIACNTAHDCYDLLRYSQPYIPLAAIFVSDVPLSARLLNAFPFPIGQMETQLPGLRQILQGPISEAHVTFKPHAERLNFEEMLLPRYSAQGPTPYLTLSPDVVTLGQKAAVTGDPHVPYSAISGTSNANAGFVGMLALAVCKWHVAERTVSFSGMLQQAQNTAIPQRIQPTSLNHNSFLGLAYPVFRQGAGMVYLDAFLRTRVIADPPRIEFKWFEPMNCDVLKKTLTLHNHDDRDLIYNLHHLPAIGLVTDPYLYAYHEHKSEVDVWFFSTSPTMSRISQIQVKARSSFNVEVHFMHFKRNPQFTFINGYIHFIPLIQQGISYHNTCDLPEAPTILSIPYFFLHGDFGRFPTIILKGTRAPFLTDATILPYAHDYLPRVEGYPVYDSNSREYPMFTFEGDSRVVVSVCFRFLLENVRFDLYRYPSDSMYVGVIGSYSHLEDACYLFFLTPDPIQFLPGQERSDVLDKLEHVGWNGMVRNPETKDIERVGNGMYTLCISTSKLQDTDMNIEDYPAWCSIPFQV